MENYEQMLDEVYAKIKPIEASADRFESPKIEGHLEGTKTVLTNIPQISSYLRRNQEHLIKFLLRELATAGSFRDSVLILQRKINSQRINEKIEDYVKEFVLCKQCGKPDTEIVKDQGISFMHCLACGAKHPVRTKI